MVDAIGLSRACLRDPDIKIPLRAAVRLLETSAKAAKIDNFGLRLSERRLLSNLGPIGLIAREQPTVRKAIEALVRYIGLHSDALTVRIEQQDDLVIISPVLLIGGSLPIRQVIELNVGVTCRTLRTFLGASWKPMVVRFAHGPPRSRDVHKSIRVTSRIRSGFQCRCLQGTGPRNAPTGIGRGHGALYPAVPRFDRCPTKRHG